MGRNHVKVDSRRLGGHSSKLHTNTCRKVGLLQICCLVMTGITICLRCFGGVRGTFIIRRLPYSICAALRRYQESHQCRNWWNGPRTSYHFYLGGGRPALKINTGLWRIRLSPGCGGWLKAQKMLFKKGLIFCELFHGLVRRNTVEAKLASMDSRDDMFDAIEPNGKLLRHIV